MTKSERKAEKLQKKAEAKHQAIATAPTGEAIQPKKRTIVAGHPNYEKLIAKADAKKGIAVTEKSEKTKEATKKVTKKNVEKAHKKTQEKEAKPEKGLKYTYPEDCKTKSQKKEFRRKARATIKAYAKEITKFENTKGKKSEADLLESKAAYEEWAKDTFTKPLSVDDLETEVILPKSKKSKKVYASTEDEEDIDEEEDIYEDDDEDEDIEYEEDLEDDTEEDD